MRETDNEMAMELLSSSLLLESTSEFISKSDSESNLLSIFFFKKTLVILAFDTFDFWLLLALVIPLSFSLMIAKIAKKSEDKLLFDAPNEELGLTTYPAINSFLQKSSFLLDQ